MWNRFITKIPGMVKNIPKTTAIATIGTGIGFVGGYYKYHNKEPTVASNKPIAIKCENPAIITKKDDIKHSDIKYSDSKNQPRWNRHLNTKIDHHADIYTSNASLFDYFNVNNQNKLYIDQNPVEVKLSFNECNKCDHYYFKDKVYINLCEKHTSDEVHLVCYYHHRSIYNKEPIAYYPPPEVKLSGYEYVFDLSLFINMCKIRNQSVNIQLLSIPKNNQSKKITVKLS